MDGKKEEDFLYLQLDKYSRGTIEREILALDTELKQKRKEKILRGK